MHDQTLNALRMYYKMLPVGIPETSTGVEQKLLKTLFTEDQAHAVLHVTQMGRTAKEIADSLGKRQDETTELLEAMYHKGILMRKTRSGSDPIYRVQPFIPGIYEFQVDSMDEDFARMMEELHPELAPELGASKTPVMRVVPTESSVSLGTEVAPYERAVEIVEESKKIVLAECICRKQKKLMGRGCDRPRDDICIIFSPWAEMYVDLGIGREATVDEARESLQRGEQAGLVRTVANAKRRPLAMCQCCPDCCIFLRAATTFGQPSVLGDSNYVPVINKDACEGCPDCIDVCPMKAMSLVKGRVRLNGALCIGCGLCVSACGHGAVTMRRKAANKVVEPPETMAHMLATVAAEKGRSFV